ncbi:hypothetical protein BJY24_001984 [Nocardia transvalensis]|uniref:Uncharacterized protein n=1 Tax=Nocardia transvalensis TaxID=37333 RepID=A0A7W9PBM6_9NOCA|nr:hypothetical protein [Nocardia transvalensis]MBB5913117.1 hypothetical protein [Nocardia transvalensis]
MTQPAANEPLLRPLTPAADAHLVLANLGLTVDILHAALDSGEQAASSATKYHPLLTAGMERWIATVAGLRSRLVQELEWTLEDPKGSPRVVRPDGELSIMVIGGTIGTGQLDGPTPSNKNRRGPSTGESVNSNQLALPLDISIPITGTGPEEILTWVLLYYRAKDPNETRAELSLPSKVVKNRIVEWEYRIILPPISHNLPLPPDVDGDGDGGIDFPIVDRGR